MTVKELIRRACEELENIPSSVCTEHLRQLVRYAEEKHDSLRQASAKWCGNNREKAREVVKECRKKRYHRDVAFRESAKKKAYEWRKANDEYMFFKTRLNTLGIPYTKKEHEDLKAAGKLDLTPYQKLLEKRARRQQREKE